MKPIEGRRPVHKEMDTNQPNEGEAKELDNQETEIKKTKGKKTEGQKSEGQKSVGQKSEGQKSEDKSTSSYFGINKVNLYCIPTIGVVALAVISGTYLFSKGEEINGVAEYLETNKESELLNALEDLENTYSKQTMETWISLASGIKSVLREKPNKPSVFLMLYDTDSAGKTAKCIAVDASKEATKFLISRAESPVIINPNELGDQRYLQDPGLVLTEYNNTIREKGALIVPNLQEVPPKVAEMFHFICDKYTPLVETAVMFFTLKVDIPPTNVKLQDVATQTLEKLWSKSMKDNILYPLITRLVPNIVGIISDSANC